MKNSLRFFYGVILFALCQVGLTNCSDGDDGENNGSAEQWDYRHYQRDGKNGHGVWGDG